MGYLLKSRHGLLVVLVVLLLVVVAFMSNR